MKSYHVHYMNKYPGGKVFSSENSIDVYCERGFHRVALRKDGGGSWVDRSKEFGALDEHSLEPIPKDSRVMKLYRKDRDDVIAPAEEHGVRKQASAQLAVDGKILSIPEYEKKGFKFEADGSLKSAPAQKE